MTEKQPVSKKAFSADWFFRGALTKIGDSLDRLTGRKWIPSSSLATSEIVERIKKLLDDEIQDVAGKGKVAPHNIKLKMQWNKFSDDSGDALKVLENELLAAAVDHINDSHYYTFAPVSLEVKPDYFIEGVKLYVSFDKFHSEDRDVELNVTVPSINAAEPAPSVKQSTPSINEIYVARFEINGARFEKQLEFPSGGRCSVGRTAGDLLLDHSSVSKIHASLVAGADGFLSVADTGSTNGTFINGQRIAYGKAVRLDESDRLKFGEIEVIFERLPKPVFDEPEAELADESQGESVEIDGFEFKSRVSPENEPGTVSGIGSNPPAGSDAGSPVITIPDPTPDDLTGSGSKDTKEDRTIDG